MKYLILFIILLVPMTVAHGQLSELQREFERNQPCHHPIGEIVDMIGCPDYYVLVEDNGEFTIIRVSDGEYGNSIISFVETQEWVKNVKDWWIEYLVFENEYQNTLEYMFGL